MGSKRGYGFARIKTLIDEKKQEDPDTLVLDGGDFSMGTLIQTVYDTEAAELRMLGYLGYDVTTLGNHEYDYRSKDWQICWRLRRIPVRQCRRW